MKKTSIVLWASLLAAFAIVSPVLAKDPPASAEQLRSELESALKAKNTNAVLSLINWEGVSDKMKSSQIRMMDGLLTEDVQSVTLGPVPASSRLAFEWNGVRYSPNVSVVGFVEIKK